MLRHEKGAEGADSEGSLDLGWNEIKQWTAGSGARIVNDHVRCAGMFFDIVEQLSHLTRTGCIASVGARSSFPAQLGELVRLPRRQTDPHAFAAK